MKMKNITLTSIALATLASANVVSAGEIEGNVALGTDYVFRGFSQTDEEIAISGGFDYSFENGFYLGTWGSNVNFGDDASAEIDLYGGYAFEVGGGAEVDLTYVYYVYPGETDALNYSEFQAAVSFNDLTLGLIYSPDYFGSDADAYVLNADYSISLADNWGLDLHVGYSDVDQEFFFGEDDSYVDYSAAITTSGAGVDFALTYYGTDIDDIEVADDRVVFSISKAF